MEQPRPEVPQRAFTSITDGQRQLTIANRGLPEVEVLKNSEGNSEIAVTLLRCIGWLSRDDFANRSGHAGPFMETPGAQMPGQWEFDYSIVVGQIGHLSHQQAWAFEAPLRAAAIGLHTGALPAAGSFVSVEPAGFLVSAVKTAENGKGWLVRGYNLTSQALQVNLKPLRRFPHAALCNLAEEELSPLQASKDGSVTITAPGHGIVSVRFCD